MCVGKKIKERRKELRINAEELAEAAEVSPSTIFRYEKGEIEKMPTIVLERIAKKLRTTPAYLMGWESDDTIAAHMDDDLTDDEKLQVQAYIAGLKANRK